MAFGSLSLLLSRIAEPKVTQPLLKQFAMFEIAEQETIADVLTSLQTNAAPRGVIEAPSDTTLMQHLDDTGKASVENLRRLNAGAELDRDYLRYQVEGHHKLLAIQEAYLKTFDNLDETNIAKLASGMIKEHLVLLKKLDQTG